MYIIHFFVISFTTVTMSVWQMVSFVCLLVLATVSLHVYVRVHVYVVPGTATSLLYTVALA